MSFEIRKIGVIGAGQMGSGIAQVCAQAGMDVLINDVSVDRINAGLATINGNLQRLQAKEQLSDTDRQKAMSLILPAAEFEAFADCDLVIEAASENEEVKRKIFMSLCPVLKPETMLASNTSSISITRLASTTVNCWSRRIPIHVGQEDASTMERRNSSRSASAAWFNDVEKTVFR